VRALPDKGDLRLERRAELVGRKDRVELVQLDPGDRPWREEAALPPGHADPVEIPRQRRGRAEEQEDQEEQDDRHERAEVYCARFSSVKPPRSAGADRH
jgi:hypothetical protein